MVPTDSTQYVGLHLLFLSIMKLSLRVDLISSYLQEFLHLIRKKEKLSNIVFQQNQSYV